MPIYEYHCEPCHHTFETLVRNERDVPRCPRCGSVELQKEFSVPAAAQTGSARGPALPMCGPSPMGGACGMGMGGGGCGSGMCGMG